MNAYITNKEKQPPLPSWAKRNVHVILPPHLSKRNVHVIGENYEMVVGFFRFFACSKFLIFFSLVLFYFGEKILGWTWLIRQSGTWQGRMRWSQVGGKNFLVGWACPFFNAYPSLNKTIAPRPIQVEGKQSPHPLFFPFHLLIFIMFTKIRQIKARANNRVDFDLGHIYYYLK